VVSTLARAGGGLAYAPWGRVAEEFWVSPVPGLAPAAPGAPPEPVRARLAEVAAAERAEGPKRALALIAALDAEIAAVHGEVHLFTARVREVRAQVTAMTGDHEGGVVLCLHAAQLLASVLGPGHPDVEGALGRAYAMWRAMPDEAGEGARRSAGGELLRVAGDLRGC
jgi:hypothetical protein